jgi:hypothetical protein
MIMDRIFYHFHIICFQVNDSKNNLDYRAENFRQNYFEMIERDGDLQSPLVIIAKARVAKVRGFLDFEND